MQGEGIGQNPEDYRVKPGRASKVVRVFYETDELIGFPVSELEGTGADRVAIVDLGPLGRFYLLENVGREDALHPA